MVINLSRYRTAIICGLVLLITVLIAFRMNSDKPAGEKENNQLKSANEYGEFLPWQEVKNIFPKYARATISDFETKKSFQVQKRAGSSHADVQPLTARDTAIMKDIYHGRWSWKRRAVIVTLEDGTRIAASMAGMPHGSGAIRGNRFNGHFCLHFRDSKTHGSGNVDPAHQMMIWKAAGRLDSQLTAMPPGELIKAFFTALNQGDSGIASSMVNEAEKADLVQDMKSVESLQVESIKELSTMSFQVRLRIQYQGSPQITVKNGQVLLIPNVKGCLVYYPSVQPWLRQPQP